MTVDDTGVPQGATAAPDDEADLAATVLRLVAELEARLPPAVVRVERDPGVGDRLAGRPGPLTSVVVDTGEGRLLVLDAGPRGFACSSATRVGGVVVARRRLRLSAWLARLDAFLAAREEETAIAEAAAQRVLVTLGSAEPSDALTVHADSLDADLADLPAHVDGRVPADVVDAVRRICDELRETHDRLPAGAQHAHLVHRVATDYLPTTLRIYLELPQAWAQQYSGFGGRTALDILREQLDILEIGVRELHRAVLEDDGERLLANGAFLADRFGNADSDLHLPDHTD